MLFALDPMTLLAGNGVVWVVLAVGGAFLLFRNKDKLKNLVNKDEPSDGRVSGIADVKHEAATIIDEIDRKVLNSDLVRGGCSRLCCKMMKVADALPNKAAAAKAHQALRDCFVEFGDPTPASEDSSSKIMSM